jgi:hypothetical protein
MPTLKTGGYLMHKTPDAGRNGSRLQVRIFAVMATTLALIILSAPAEAHSPSGVTISFDPNTAKLSVTITHVVDDPATHYLYQVQVRQNGLVISDPLYKSQPSKDTFTLTYDVNANPGDAIWVTANCIRGGRIEKSYEVPQPIRPTTKTPGGLPAGQLMSSPEQSRAPPVVPPTTKAALGLLPLLGAAAVWISRGNAQIK